MKTNFRRRAREIKYGFKGTGGWAPVKSLTDLEERLLRLLSVLTIEGATLVEASGADTLVDTSTLENDNLFNIENIPIIVDMV